MHLDSGPPSSDGKEFRHGDRDTQSVQRAADLVIEHIHRAEDSDGP